MEEHELEGRLSKLKQTYEHIEMQANPKEISAKLKQEQGVKPSPKKRRVAWRVPVIAAAAVLVMFIISATYLQDELTASTKEEGVTEFGPASYEEYAESLDIYYEQLKAKQLAKSGLEEQQFNAISTMKSAEEYYKYNRESFMKEELITDPATLYTKVTGEIERMMKLPEDLIEDVHKTNGTLPLDVVESGKLIGDYFALKEKVTIGSVINSEIKPLLTEEEQIALKEIVDPKWYPIIRLEQFTVMYDDVHGLPIEEASEFFAELEVSYADPNIQLLDNKYQVVAVLYRALFGSFETEPLFKKSGVPEEFRKEWKEFANQPESSISHRIFAPIVEEMESSNWTSSPTWEATTMERLAGIVEKLDGATSEQLSYVGEVQVVDADFSSRVHELFKSNSMKVGPDKYADASPFEIIGLYYYYEELGERYLQYDMLLDDPNFFTISFEEYETWPMNEGRKLSDFTKSLSFVRYDMDFAQIEMNLTEEGAKEFGQDYLTFQLYWTKDGWKVPLMPTQ